MNPVVTSKEEILKTSRKLIQQQGWTAINIRSVAAACGVSVGSIYNYFDSKSALISAVVESIWCEIFHRPEDKSGGRQKMQQTWQHILEELCAVLNRDSQIRPGAFTGEFTAEKFADVLFSLMLSAFLRQDYDPSAALEIVRRTLY